MSTNLPPFDGDAEEAVLGAILIDNDQMLPVSLLLAAKDFYRDVNRWPFEACETLYLRGEAINQVTVASELERKGKLADCGGPVHLAHCISQVPTSSHAEHFAGIVKACSMNRQLIGVAGKLAQIGYENRKDTERALEEAEALLMGLRQTEAVKGLVPIRPILEEYLTNLTAETKDASRSKRISTGIGNLDHLLGGLHSTDLIILAARPGQGKTSMLLNIATVASLGQKLKTAIFSVEMSRDQLAERLLSGKAMIDSQKLQRGEISDEEHKRLIWAASELAEMGIWVDDSSTLTSGAIRSKSRMLARQHGLDLVIVDYLQLMDGGNKRDNRVAELGEITRTLKGLAKELGVPVLAAAQLSRAIEHRSPKKPILSDLRDSGNLEQDADVVMFLYSEDESNLEARTLDIAKHRHGPTGSLVLKFTGQYTRFYGLDEQHKEPEGGYYWQDKPSPF
jgi:replicative DNA helicase